MGKHYAHTDYVCANCGQPLGIDRQVENCNDGTTNQKLKLGIHPCSNIAHCWIAKLVWGNIERLEQAQNNG